PVADVAFDRFGRRVHDAGATLAFFDLEPELVFGAKPLRRRLVNGLIDIGKDTQLHQISNQLERFLVQPLGQVPDDDRRLEGDEFAGGWRDKFRRRRERRERGGVFSSRPRRKGGPCLFAGGFGGRPSRRRFERQSNLARLCADLGRGSLGKLNESNFFANRRLGRTGWRRRLDLYL